MTKYQKIRQLIESALTEALKYRIGGWEVVMTDHAVEREAERLGNGIPGGIDAFSQMIIKKATSFKTPMDGEFMYYSTKFKQAVMVNVDHGIKQLRYITIMPAGRNAIPKPGTKKILIENRLVEVIYLD